MLNKNFLEVFEKICNDKDLIQKFQGIKNDPDKAYELALSVSPAGGFTKQEFFDGIAELNRSASESSKKANGELKDDALNQVVGGMTTDGFVEITLGSVMTVAGVLVTATGAGAVYGIPMIAGGGIMIADGAKS